MEKNRFIYLFFLILAYALSSLFFHEDPGEVYLLVSILFWVGVLSITGFISSIYSEILTSVRNTHLQEQKIKNRLLILTFWILAVSAVKTVGWIAEHIPGSIIIFASFLPAVWLFKVSSSALSKIGFIFLLFAAVSAFGYRTTANLFAELAYFWLGTAVIIRLKGN